MKGIRLTWKLATSIVVGSHPLHLDALVAYAVAKEGMQRDPSWDVNAPLDLPLQRDVRGDLHCWMASALVPVAAGEHAMRFWTRKTNVFDYADRVGDGQIEVKTKFPLKSYGMKVDTARGIFKQMIKFYPVRQVNELQAWCVGDIDRVAELVSPEAGFINYIGAKGRMGHGRVIDFDIQQDTDAETKWQNRVLPWPQKGCLEIEAATEPPYWGAANRRRAWVSPDLFN